MDPLVYQRTGHQWRLHHHRNQHGRHVRPTLLHPPNPVKVRPTRHATALLSPKVVGRVPPRGVVIVLSQTSIPANLCPLSRIRPIPGCFWPTLAVSGLVAWKFVAERPPLSVSIRVHPRRYEFCQRGVLKNSGGSSCRADGSGVTLRTCWSANPQVGFREMLVDGHGVTPRIPRMSTGAKHLHGDRPAYLSARKRLTRVPSVCTTVRQL